MVRRLLLKLNLNKSTVLCVKQTDLHRREKVKDLRVTTDSKLSYEGHITEKVNKTYSILGLTSY